MFAVITSKDCPAGKNIKQCLLDLFHPREYGVFDDNPVYSFSNAKLYTINEKHIFAENLDKKIPADLFIFATTHSSNEAVHSLSCHIPGNWGKAELGGRAKELCIAPALLLKKAYLELKEHQDEVPDHQITMEVTHHGPYLEKPVMFIEIGSTEEHWGNKKAGEIIAKTIMKLVTENELKNQKVAVGLGGTHYCVNFNKVVERTNIAFGHMCPKWALENLNEEMIKQAIEKTREKVDLIVLDRKGLGREKARIKEILDKLKIEYTKTDKLR